MSFIDRASLLIEHISLHLPAGRPPRNQPTRDELERQAAAEIQARIDLGRPGPEEAVRTRPVPQWAQRRKPVDAGRTRPLDVVAVRLDAVEPTPPVSVPDRPRPRATTAG